MNELYYTFRSVTAATAAQRVLDRNGLFCTVVRTPAKLRKQGCGYSLRVRERDGARASALLAQTGFRKTYRRRADGTWEETG